MTLDRLETSSVGRRLDGRPAHAPLQTGLSNRAAFAFGIVFVGVGALIALVGLGYVPVKEDSIHVPRWVVVLFGGMFLLPGLMMWHLTWRQFRAQRRQLRARRLHPLQPALADYPWDRSGFSAPRWPRAFKMLLATALAGAAAVGFAAWAFKPGSTTGAKVAAVLGLLIAFSMAWETAVRFLRAFRFGGSVVRFGQFPFVPGKRIRLRWRPARGIGHVRRGTFTLRCINELWQTSGETPMRCVHERWSQTWHIDSPRQWQARDELELNYDPPADLPSTRLNVAAPAYWELQVQLDLPGLDFSETYLVPVYAADELPETVAESHADC